MKLGVQIADYAWEGGPSGMAETLARIARTADDAGFDVIGVADHLWQGAHLGGPEQPELECFTTLGVVATHTRRCRLVPLVAGVHFRQPALLAKMITTLDVLSGGRAMLGIGAGWYEEEARGLGFPFPPLAERFEMLEEAIQICLRMWQGERGDERPFAGKHYDLERPLNVPQSLSRPHPPILIGDRGSGRRCASSHATPTRATSIPLPTCRPSSTSCAGTARRRAETMMPSRRPAWSTSPSMAGIPKRAN